MSQLERGKESRAKGKGSKGKPPREWHGFVDIPLSKDDKERLADSVFDASELLEVVEDWLSEGYKVSLSPDVEHGSTIATLTGVGAHCTNSGYSLSARGPHAPGALGALAYKHNAIAGRGSWVDVGSSRDNSVFG